MTDSPKLDLREFFRDDSELLRAAIRGQLKSLYVAMPVKVTKDTEDGNKVSVRPVIKGHVLTEEGEHDYQEMPEMEDCPIKFSGGSGHHFTHPVKKEDEGFIIFQSRNIDVPHQSGGIEQPLDHRLGNLSDGHFIPGTHSEPKKIPNYSKNTAQVRQGDKAESKVDVSDTGVLHKRGLGEDASQSHIMEAGVLTRKGETATFHTAQLVDHVSPKILLNCA